jgi:RNA polymerase sigma-70 factor (ECF subfamily)
MSGAGATFFMETPGDMPEGPLRPPPTGLAGSPGADGAAESGVHLTDDLGDVALVRAARGGDLDAFDGLVVRHRERIYNLIYHMTSHHEDATDLAQDVFVKAWKALGNFKGESSFYTWVYRIAVNHTLNHLKQRRNRTVHLSLNDMDFNAENDPDLVQLVSHQTPRRAASLKELSQRLNAAMQKLSEEHRAVVVMHDIQGMPHDEIAGVLDCNPGTVRSRLYYARQQLQAHLSDLLH